jgi:hypothetical protein
MKVNFVPKGRLGNAIFRYLASTIICLYSDGIYCVCENQKYNFDDKEFMKYIDGYKNITDSINMVGFYQHDDIYKNNKTRILDYMRINKEHYILTDGVFAGDRNLQKFYINDLINTPSTFSKRYETVLHIRLEDYVTNNMVLPIERLYILFNEKCITKHVCIVSSPLRTYFEKNYINKLMNFFKTKGITYNFETNDILTDFYIMKESKTLICSRSSISWCAAFLSNRIEKCYFSISCKENSKTVTYKCPIDNTEYY